MKYFILLSLFTVNVALADQKDDIELSEFQLDRLFTTQSQRSNKSANNAPNKKITLSDIVRVKKHSGQNQSIPQQIKVTGFIFDANGNETVWISHDHANRTVLYRNEKTLEVLSGGVRIGKGDTVSAGQDWGDSVRSIKAHKDPAGNATPIN